MSVSSLTMAAAAVGTSSHSLSSTSTDHLSLHLFPFKANPIKVALKLKTFLNYPPFSSFSRSSLYCTSTAFDSVELNTEEEEEDNDEEKEEEAEDPQDGIQETLSEVKEEEADVSQPAAAGRLYVGNLPFSMTSAQLSEIFAEAGRVVSVEVCI